MATRGQIGVRIAVGFGEGLDCEDVAGDVVVLAVGVGRALGLLEAGEGGEVVEEGLVHLGVINLHLRAALPHLHPHKVLLHLPQQQVKLLQRDRLQDCEVKSLQCLQSFEGEEGVAVEVRDAPHVGVHLRIYGREQLQTQLFYLPQVLPFLLLGTWEGIRAPLAYPLATTL
jgi:hypothetical protein